LNANRRYTEEYYLEIAEYYRKVRENDLGKAIPVCVRKLGINDKTPNMRVQ
jgi:hypothetical protein